MTIFEFKSPQFSRYIDINIEGNGTFRMDQQDLGPAVNEEHEYEWCASNIDLHQLYELFQVQDQDSLFQVIAQKYGNENGFDQFTDFIYSKKIKYDCWAG